jgi:hypothetical protein
MNVHIVCARLAADRVLPRLARTLAEVTGWTIAELPNPQAKLNYFFPYLELQRKSYNVTPTAAWFTHKDTENPDKIRIWERVGREVGLRTLTAGIYKSSLDCYGTVAMVRPAIDPQFIPVNRKRGRVIGLNGFLYNDNRKGEDMIARLLKSDATRDCQWRACGRNWPVETKTYSWANMPGFFQSLDLFICASRIEGVPMPPLEALSCGVPVIIPRGVGMLDDLPDTHGIYRFNRGDYDDLYRVFKLALDDRPANKDKLRAAVEPYNKKNWANDHITAFEKYLFGTKPMIEEKLPQWQGNSGIYCVAFGPPSRACAQRLITSCKKFMPGVPIALVSNEPLKAGEDIFIKHPDSDIGGRNAKLMVDRLAPKAWRYILYLDADTELMEDISHVFSILQDGWEFIICKDQDERHYLAKMRRGDNDKECDYTEDLVGTDRVMQYNGGVFAYRRNENTQRFFEGWIEEYQKWGKRDQGALIRSFYTNRLRTFVLMNQHNASDRYPFPPGPLAIIHHNMQARRWDKHTIPANSRLDSKEAWAAVERWQKQNVNP